MKELIDYAERMGLENLRSRLQVVETLARESNALLMILLAGIGGSLAYAVKGIENAAICSLTAGSVAFCAWLMGTAGLLVYFCIMTDDLQTPTNEPMNLYQPEYTVEEIRAVELRNIDSRIKLTIARNQRVAFWLDRVRIMAIASPVVFAITAIAWAVV